jgi:hypothetical protein
MTIRPITDRERAIITAREQKGARWVDIATEFHVSDGHRAYSQAVEVWCRWMNRVHYKRDGFLWNPDTHYTFEEGGE